MSSNTTAVNALSIILSYVRNAIYGTESDLDKKTFIGVTNDDDSDDETQGDDTTLVKDEESSSSTPRKSDDNDEEESDLDKEEEKKKVEDTNNSSDNDDDDKDDHKSETGITERKKPMSKEGTQASSSTTTTTIPPPTKESTTTKRKKKVDQNSLQVCCYRYSMFGLGLMVLAWIFYVFHSVFLDDSSYKQQLAYITVKREEWSNIVFHDAWNATATQLEICQGNDVCSYNEELVTKLYNLLNPVASIRDQYDDVLDAYADYQRRSFSEIHIEIRKHNYDQYFRENYGFTLLDLDDHNDPKLDDEYTAMIKDLYTSLPDYNKEEILMILNRLQFKNVIDKAMFERLITKCKDRMCPSYTKLVDLNKCFEDKYIESLKNDRTKGFVSRVRFTKEQRKEWETYSEILNNKKTCTELIYETPFLMEFLTRGLNETFISPEIEALINQTAGLNQ